MSSIIQALLKSVANSLLQILIGNEIMINLKHFAQALLSQCKYMEELECENFVLREKLDMHEEHQKKMYVSMNESVGKILTSLVEKTE